MSTKEKGGKDITVVKKTMTGFKKYLTDWRNLLGHSLLGILFLVIAIWAPINIWIKIIIIVILVTFNIFRMRKRSNKKT